MKVIRKKIGQVTGKVRGLQKFKNRCSKALSRVKIIKIKIPMNKKKKRELFQVSNRSNLFHRSFAVTTLALYTSQYPRGVSMDTLSENPKKRVRINL